MRLTGICNSSVLFLARSKQFGELRTFCAFAVDKAHWKIVPFFGISENLAITYKQYIY